MQNYFEVQAGATSQMVEFEVRDSSSATFALLAGLVYNTASLTAYYNRQNAAGAATAMTLATMTKGTWVNLGFIAVDATNMPGVYQLCLPNAAIAAAAGVNFVTVVLKGAANMVPVTLLIRLTNWVASTAPANTLDVSATGEAGLDFANIKNATGATQIGTVLAADQAVNVTKVLGTAQTAGDLAALIGDVHAVDLPAVKADTLLLVKGRFNRVDTDPITGDETVYDDDSTTPLKAGPIYEDVAGTMPFDGTGANRRDRMT